MGCDRVDRFQDRLHGADAVQLGATGRARPWQTAQHDDRRSGAHQVARARGPRAAPGQRDPAQGQRVFCPGGARPPMEAMIRFVDAYRDNYGVEPICKVLAIAPSTYHAHVARRAKPATAPARVQRDTLLGVEIKRVFNENFQVYGVRKVWRQLLREGYEVARCTVARLMKKMALQGVIRGRRVR